MDMTRRRFFKSVGAGLAAHAVAASTHRAGAAPSERVRHAVIGSGSQGQSHIKSYARHEDCDVVAVCDVDPERRAQGTALVTRAAPAQYEDYRRVLDDPSIDSVSVVTPDHWHAPIAIAALMAGKHVYVEKPCCHNVREGQLLAKAVRKSGKCCQHGTQQRSLSDRQEAIQILRDGGIGKVRLAKAINHQLRKPIGRALAENPPSGVNYDLWLGPAPQARFTGNRWHYNWHWFWDYGTGDIGNDGSHQIDVARWGLGVEYPLAVSASGGQLFYDDDHETPDTQIVTYEFPECYLVYEMRLWTDYPLEGHDNGNIFYGDKGTLEIGRKGCFVNLIGEAPRQIGERKGDRMRVFLDAVKADDPSLLTAGMSEALPSATLCHLGNIATRVKCRLRYDDEKHQCIDDAEANALLTRTYKKGYELPTV
jgi:predicted dehydrogenase